MQLDQTKKPQTCIDQSPPLAHKLPPDVFVPLASAQTFFFFFSLLLSTTRTTTSMVVTLMPFHPC